MPQIIVKTESGSIVVIDPVFDHLSYHGGKNGQYIGGFISGDYEIKVSEPLTVIVDGARLRTSPVVAVAVVCKTNIEARSDFTRVLDG